MTLSAYNMIAGAAGAGLRARREISRRPIDQGKALPTFRKLRS